MKYYKIKKLVVQKGTKNLQVFGTVENFDCKDIIIKQPQFFQASKINEQ